jgi:hypothetical protein
MTQDEYKQLVRQGDIAARAKPVSPAPQNSEPTTLNYRFEDFLPLLFELLAPKQHVTAAPTVTPRNFLEAIQLMDDGVNRRLYVFVDGTWRYSTLT